MHCPDYCPSSEYDHGLRQSNGKNYIFAFSFIYCDCSFLAIPPSLHSTLVVYLFSELYSIVFHPTFSCSRLPVLLPSFYSLCLYRPIRLPHQSLLYPTQPYSILPLPPHPTIPSNVYPTLTPYSVQYTIVYLILLHQSSTRFVFHPTLPILPCLTLPQLIRSPPQHTHTRAYFTIPFPPLPTLFRLHLTQGLRHDCYRFCLVN